MTSLLLDLIVVVVVLFQTVMGIRRGFVLGTLDLVGWVVALSLTLLLVTPAANLVQRFLSIPRGIAGLATALFLLFAIISLYALVIQRFYLWLVARHRRKNFLRVDRILGSVPGTINGLIIAGLLLELILLVPISTALADAVMQSRLAQPLAGVALNAGRPFASLAQEAALDVNGYLTKRFGEPATRLTLPVTELTTDTAAEKRMLELVNAERTQRGLQPLVLDARLTQVARQHSEEMLQLRYFAHDSPKLGSPFERMTRAGIRYRVAGENLALAPNAERAHVGLMNSPEHRDNILRPEFRKVGIGVINGGLSGEMFTQDFTD